MGRLIEGFWNCAYCDNKRIRGSIRECPNCGRHRDDNVKFYMDGVNYVNEEKAKAINRNPDWLCSYCDGFNSDDVNECPTCGASREESEKNYFEHRAEVEARRTERERLISQASGVSGGANDCHSEPKRNKSCSSDKGNNKTSLKNRIKGLSWGNIFKIGAGALAAIMLIMCLVWLFTPKIQEVTIQDFSWERSISVEEYRTVEKSDWYLPSGARLHYSQQELKGYEKVLDHYETKTREYTEQVIDHYETYVSGYRDLGNGFFEEIESQRPVYRTEKRTETYQEPVYRDEPIYATKYYYEIDEWQHAYYSKSSGNDKDPYWKEVELKEKQREGGRTETYYITVLTEKDEKKKYSFNFDVWNELEKGETVTIKTTIFGPAELVVNDKVVAAEN